MKSINKIHINKSDEVAFVVEKIIDADAREVVLSVPRFSKLAESLANFHLIKREADLLKRKVIIESVDDKVIELAGIAGLDSVNPVLTRSRRQFSDIITKASPESQNESAIDEASSALTASSAASGKKKPRGPLFRANSEVLRRILILGVLVIAVVGFGLFLFKALPRADIRIVIKKIPWNFNDSITLDKSAGNAQVFKESRNVNFAFPASGKKKIEKASSGTITIFNAYSSDPQPLVQKTRFVSPDGKVFRLATGVTVPAAKIVQGEIVPSSIDAAVVADSPGADYNIGPVDYFNIPGFKGTSKYSGFYATSKTPMAGGFIGEVAVPTVADISGAKEEARKKVQDALRVALLTKIPSEFNTTEDTSSFKIMKENIASEADEKGNFSVFIEAEMTVIAFREKDVLDIITATMKKERGNDYVFKDFTIEYGKARADFAAGHFSFPVKLQGIIIRPVDTTLLLGRVVGQLKPDLDTIISSLPDFEDGSVSFWPFWVKRVPVRESRIRIDVL